MYKKGEPILYEKLSWDEATLLGKDPGLILLAPGTLEQHGFHCSMDVDAAINYEICKRVSAKLGVPVFPKIMPGISQSHGFPGTVWVRPETFMAYLYDIIRSLVESGYRQFLLLNGHMWNQSANLGVRDNARCDFPHIQIRVMNWWSFDNDVYRLVSQDCPLGRSLHGNIGETACMLAIDPENQDMEKAKRLKVDNPEYEHFWDYREEQMTTSGVMGASASEATAELGEEIIALATEKLIAMLKPAMKEKPRYVSRQKHPGLDV
mmetsp:Transcript_1182/g.878  ORF Transcript_1182/g.878 Transcript_1182/m.878 type:complete len:264 (-) Transcript_1182:392-1183(-)|eukprot:CAMPEP_0201283416 /NCGR_PEP_ID=MMETSP1317-20130820/8485_1 /ASSEMBLY_ACC=CAM_ASM_000770 /TAXON_ID=187299 /ORGANISM="Undescribed Undescribed, Strain Undescribed" /LENGTH=263 /DNA_ID=CAMNT_0047599571 /DNA_START=129 /DNA_END=920 /DNA_ORIENTATION=+